MFKHIVSAAALIAASTALASAATTITDLSSAYSDDTVTYTVTDGIGYLSGDDLFEATNGDKNIAASSTVILDLSALSSVSGDTKILAYQTSEGSTSSEIGIYATSGGTLVFSWAGSTWNTSTYSASYEVLSALDTDGDGYITVTVVANDNTNGTTVYDAEGNTVGTLTASGLKGSSASYSVIYIDTTYITAISVAAGIASTEEIQESSSTLAEEAGIPEPSSFGLLAGIGALALVAARRRRR